MNLTIREESIKVLEKKEEKVAQAGHGWHLDFFFFFF